MIGIGVIGYGYWGPNLARCVAEAPGCSLVAIADLSPKARARAALRYASVPIEEDWRRLLANPAIDAVAITTPTRSHFEIALAALKAGKHVLVEKPMTETSAEAARLIEEAARRNLVLMVDHTFVYTGAVQKVKDLIVSGVTGDVFYYDSTRINLGLFQTDVNVVWDLAVHDLAILDFLLEAQPLAISANGAGHIKGRLENMAHISLYLNGGTTAHLNVNWLSPVKMRRVLIGGSRRMVVYDDMEPSEKVKIYDSGVDFPMDTLQRPSAEEMHLILPAYRMGDVWTPHIPVKEALLTEIEHFGHCVANGLVPLTSGESGLRVVSLLEAASQSMRQRGNPIDLAPLKVASMIPLLDLDAQYAAVQRPLEDAVLEVLRSGHYVLGEPVAAFEREFADYCGTQHAVALNSGTSALHLALMAAGIGPGDEVVTVAMTFVATVAAILYTGATPVLVDVDPATFTMDPSAFEAAITPRTRAVIPVHLHGRLADMAAISAIAERHGITVIEDAAQAHGAERDGRRAGTFGTIGCFSFYPGKNLGACGEGGAIVTGDAEIAARIRSLQDWGQNGSTTTSTQATITGSIPFRPLCCA